MFLNSLDNGSSFRDNQKKRPEFENSGLFVFCRLIAD
jgi:hypothetical protein